MLLTLAGVPRVYGLLCQFIINWYPASEFFFTLTNQNTRSFHMMGLGQQNTGKACLSRYCLPSRTYWPLSSLPCLVDSNPWRKSNWWASSKLPPNSSNGKMLTFAGLVDLRLTKRDIPPDPTKCQGFQNVHGDMLLKIIAFFLIKRNKVQSHMLFQQKSILQFFRRTGQGVLSCLSPGQPPSGQGDGALRRAQRRMQARQY